MTPGSSSAARPLGGAAQLQYGLVLGQGRSGTNMLMGILDQSPRTHCRNEPDQLPDGALARLGPYRFFVDDPQSLERVWDGAILDGAMRIGPRDHPVRVPKDWLYGPTWRPGIKYIYARYRAVHKLIHRTKPMDGRERDWPRWMTTSARLRSAVHVFKINSAVGLARWALGERPDMKALHIVRHPGGFAKSWHKRWIQGETPQQRSDQRMEWDEVSRLVGLAERDPSWARRMGDVERMSAVEREMWWWLYCTEETWRAGARSPSYHRLLFEDLAHRTVDTARGVFAFLGLGWTPEVEARVAPIGHGSARIAGAWKDELGPELLGVVERVVDGSPVLGWWPD